MQRAASLVVAVALMLAGCGREQSAPATPGAKTGAKPPGRKAMAMTLSSASFASGERMPKKHAYEGEGDNVSPPLSWSGVPDGTKELALICDDPDAPREEPWVHWVVYAISAEAQGLAEGDVGGARVGVSDFSTPGYGGPMPPKGHGVHRYFFRLYALDQPLSLQPGATKKQLLAAMQGHILGQAELMGTYERR